MLTIPGGRRRQLYLDFINWEQEGSRWLHKEEYGCFTRTENKEAISVYQTHVDVYSWLRPVEKWLWAHGDRSHHRALLNTWRMFLTVAFSTGRVTGPSLWVPQTHPLYCLSSFQLSWNLGGPALALSLSLCVWLWIAFSLPEPQHLILWSWGQGWIRWELSPTSLDISGVCRRPSLFRSGKLSLCLLSTNRKIEWTLGWCWGCLLIFALFLQDNSIQQFNSTNIYWVPTRVRRGFPDGSVVKNLPPM